MLRNDALPVDQRIVVVEMIPREAVRMRRKEDDLVFVVTVVPHRGDGLQGHMLRRVIRHIRLNMYRQPFAVAFRYRTAEFGRFAVEEQRKDRVGQRRVTVSRQFFVRQRLDALPGVNQDRIAAGSEQRDERDAVLTSRETQRIAFRNHMQRRIGRFVAILIEPRQERRHHDGQTRRIERETAADNQFHRVGYRTAIFIRHRGVEPMRTALRNRTRRCRGRRGIVQPFGRRPDHRAARFQTRDADRRAIDHRYR